MGSGFNSNGNLRERFFKVDPRSFGGSMYITLGLYVFLWKVCDGPMPDCFRVCLFVCYSYCISNTGSFSSFGHISLWYMCATAETEKINTDNSRNRHYKQNGLFVLHPLL